MLQDAIEIFKKEYEKYGGDRLIVDSYIPSDGEYILVEPKEEGFVIIDRHIINRKKGIDETYEHYDFIRNADYLSKLIDMNKPIDPKKIIHSNNYFTFFVKKENVHNGKLTKEIIEKYYEVLKNPLLKYNKSKVKKLYQEIEQINGAADEKIIEKVESWIKYNIFQLVKEDKDKSYLKIFFKYDLDQFRKESEKYILPNIYNNNDYNITVDDEIYGLPNDNMGMNSKKPFLENKTRKTKVPYLLSVEEVLMQKKFFDYLLNKASEGKTNIYISYVNGKKIEALTNDETLSDDFNGYFLRIKKGKEVEIHDFDTLGLFKINIKPMNLTNALRLEKSKIEYTTINTISSLKNLINEVFFNKFLTTNYFTDPGDININDRSLKRNILLTRTALFSWFYKGNSNNIWKLLDFSSLDLIKGSIANGYLAKAGDQYNLRCALKNYFEGGDNMSDILINTKNSLREKINQNDTGSIENDKEYFFAVGQLTYYFISLNKGKNKAHSLANPMFNAKTDEKLKNELRKLYKKYNYTIDMKYKRLKNMYYMVVSYVPEGKVNEDLIIAGYLHSNLIYEENKKGENSNE